MSERPHLIASNGEPTEAGTMSDDKAGLPKSEPLRLREALREARIESAERTAVFHDLQDAELARLEQLNDAIAPVFAEIPPNVEIFDRGITRGDTPRLWIDLIAYVVMDRDHRIYRFIQDTRNGPKILAESTSIREIVEAVTRYVARRLVERERALATSGEVVIPARAKRRGGTWRWLRYVVFVVALAVIGVLIAAWIAAGKLVP